MRTPLVLALATAAVLQAGPPKPDGGRPTTDPVPVPRVGPTPVPAATFDRGRPQGEAPARPLRRVPGVTQDSQVGHFAPSTRPSGVPKPLNPAVFLPRATPRAPMYPDGEFWRKRDIMAEIQHMARKGFIPVTPCKDLTEITGVSIFPAGWRAYGFTVPAGESIHVRLHHTNEGWFRLSMVDRWGQLREGMLQNLIPTGNPEVTYKNPNDMPNTVYVIVDDPSWMSSRANPFILKVDRSWDPAKLKAPEMPQVMGLWASVDLGVVPNPQAKPADKPAEKPAEAAVPKG
ncbi:MAG TPA: hypothetical protein VK188_04690 [Holophaga sp.]|nr:hypothetical protein [Holophaga sp.]